MSLSVLMRNHENQAPFRVNIMQNSEAVEGIEQALPDYIMTRDVILIHNDWYTFRPSIRISRSHTYSLD